LTAKTPSPSIRIFTKNSELRDTYASLKNGDIFIGRVRFRRNEEYLLLDMLERGVVFFPSALSQQICRSKVAQTVVFSEFMIPHTVSIHDQHDMMQATSYFHKHSIGMVVTKLDRKDGGLGINLWPDIEHVYNQASLNMLPYPFVIQPYMENCRDIRVIILDTYEEAYTRENAHNFRNNIHSGGVSRPYTLTENQKIMCRHIMARGKFPYAHLDLLESREGKTFLSEINLRGGIKGAKITPEEYKKRIDAIHGKFAKEIVTPLE